MFRAEDVRERLGQQPFRPLRFIVSEGLRYDVHHPDLVFVGRHDFMIGLPHDEGTTIYDRVIRIAYVHLVGIEDLPPVSAPSNGTE